MAMPPHERKTLSSLLEKLGEHVIQAELSDNGQTIRLKSKSNGRILLQVDVDDAFDADGNRFHRDI